MQAPAARPAPRVVLQPADLVYVELTQDRITVNGGLGWDGTRYFAMASGKLSDVGFPFGGRIGLPLLARHFVFSDLLRNFQVLNLFFGFVFSFLAFLTIASITPTLSLATKITSWCLLSATQLSPLVQSAWYPVQTDAAANCLLMLLVYAGLRHRGSHLALPSLHVRDARARKLPDAVRLIVAYVVVCALALVVGLQGRMDPIKRPR